MWSKGSLGQLSMDATRTAFALLFSLCVCSYAWTDSLFSVIVASEGTLISDKKVRFEVGDIITVLVRETTEASTDSNTNTKKESAVEAEASAADNEFLIAETPGGLNFIPRELLPNWKVEIENEHKTKGQTRRKNRLVMTVACTVERILETGNIEIQGMKRVTVNQEDSTLFVQGLIRPQDVTAANTIQSTQIANAIIELKGRGPLWNNQRRGLFTKVLDWFSPF